MIGLVKALDSMSGRKLFTLSELKGIIDIAITPNETLLAMAHNDGTATLWNTLNGHTDPIFDVTFSPDGARLATTSLDGTVRLWDVTSGKELIVLPEDNHEVPL